MPLIDLKTDLKNLRYGKDTPGGGYSGQPYIQAKIPVGLEPKSPDFILRGGYLTVRDSLTDIKRLGKMFGDLKSPNGILFTAKQNVLSNSAVRTQASGIVNEGIYTPLSTLAEAGVVAFGGHLNKQGKNPFRESGAFADDEYLYYNKINNYNLDWLQSGGSTALNNRLFALYQSRILNNSIGGYAKPNNINVDLTNTLLTYKGGPGSILGVGNTNIRFEDSGNKRTGVNNVQLINSGFFGEKKALPIPGSPFSINVITTPKNPSAGNYKVFKRYSGRTTELFISPLGVSNAYESSTNTLLPLNISKDGGYTFNPNFEYNVYQTSSITSISDTSRIYDNNTFTYTQKDLTESNVNSPLGDHLSPKIQDFRKILREKLGATEDQGKTSTKLGATPNSPNYQTENIETRTNIGDPGKRSNKDYSDYQKGVLVSNPNGAPGSGPSVYSGNIRALDQINALPIYKSEKVNPNLPVNDLVKFRIAAIDSSNPGFKTFMHFRAFIDSFSDSYNASWEGTQYSGRGEKLYNYSGFDRTISLSFTVAAQSKQELIPMYKKLNYLASQLAPDYSPAGYMRGPLVQLTLGGYLYEQVGFITNLTYDVPNDATWEIGIGTDGESDSTVKELPHRITVSGFNFTPIHNFRPGKQGLEFGGDGFANVYGKERYIALSNGVNTNYSK